jgi:hypothetical protein
MIFKGMGGQYQKLNTEGSDSGDGSLRCFKREVITVSFYWYSAVLLDLSTKVRNATCLSPRK